jgi:ribosomal-protein-serine acetyltransferase
LSISEAGKCESDVDLSMNPDAEVLIRPLRIDDVPALYEAVRESLPVLCLWMPWCHPDYAIEESQTWIEKQIPAFQAGEEFTFAIVSASDQFLGVIGLNAIDRDNRRANLGYWVRVSASARGVATTATQLVARWAFQHTDLNRLELVIAIMNGASLRVAEKAGAVREGILRSRLMLHGDTHDAAVFSIVRTDGEAV